VADDDRAFVGGLAMVRLGIHRALWVFGVLQAAGILLFAALAQAGKDYGLLAPPSRLRTSRSG